MLVYSSTCYTQCDKTAWPLINLLPFNMHEWSDLTVILCRSINIRLSNLYIPSTQLNWQTLIHSTHFGFRRKIHLRLCHTTNFHFKTRVVGISATPIDSEVPLSLWWQDDVFLALNASRYAIFINRLHIYTTPLLRNLSLEGPIRNPSRYNLAQIITDQVFD